MRNFIVLLSIVLFSTTMGQESSKIDGIIGMSKHDYIVSKLGLSGEQLQMFTNLYTDYSSKRSDLLKKKSQAVSELGTSVSNVNSDLTKISSTVQSYNSKEMSLLQKTYKQMIEALGQRQADKFAIIESYLIEIETIVGKEQLPLLQPGILTNKTSSSSSSKGSTTSGEGDK